MTSNDNLTPLIEIRDQMQEIETHLLNLATSWEENPPNSEKMTTTELTHVLEVFTEVVAMAKKVVVPPPPAEKDPAWDRCIGQIQTLLIYIEQIELRPLMALSNLGKLVNNFFSTLTEYGVELQIMGADED